MLHAQFDFFFFSLYKSLMQQKDAYRNGKVAVANN